MRSKKNVLLQQWPLRLEPRRKSNGIVPLKFLVKVIINFRCWPKKKVNFSRATCPTPLMAWGITFNRFRGNYGRENCSKSLYGKLAVFCLTQNWQVGKLIVFYYFESRYMHIWSQVLIQHDKAKRGDYWSIFNQERLTGSPSQKWKKIAHS